MRVTEVQFVPAEPRDRRQGLLGFVSLVLDGVVRLDGLGVRRTKRGFLGLSFPRRHGRTGTHPYIQATSREVRREIEAAVFEELGLQREDRP